MHQSELTDQELLKRTASGDREAFGDLYERYLDDIYRYIFYRVSQAEEAEDLTEAVFLRAWEGLSKARFKTKIKNFRAWLYRIAHNLVVDYHRKKKPIQVEGDALRNPAGEAALGPENIVQERLTQQAVTDVIVTLDETLQQVVILRFLEQLSHDETAEILGLKVGHVRVLQHRALKILRERLNKENEDG